MINLYMHLELYNKIVINKKKKKIFQNFQNEMCFPLLHYTSKMKRKAMNVIKKKNP
jgi:hypothetical protein